MELTLRPTTLTSNIVHIKLFLVTDCLVKESFCYKFLLKILLDSILGDSAMHT